MSRTLSGKYATPLCLEPRCSPRLGLFITVIHTAALLVLPFAGLPLPLVFPIAMAVIRSGRQAWRRHVSMTHPAAIRRLCWGDDGRWRLGYRDGTQRQATLAPRVYIHPRLVILCFRLSRWRTSSVLLTTDRLDPGTLRRLRVRLQLCSERPGGCAAP